MDSAGDSEHPLAVHASGALLRTGGEEAMTGVRGGGALLAGMARDPVALSSTRDLLGALKTARKVTLEAYILPRGALESALERAARKGADVHVRLSRPYHDDSGHVAAANAEAVERLVRSGVHIDRVRPFDHRKAAVVDGRAYLDDRNWALGGRDTVLADSRPEDVAAILDRSAPARIGDFAGRKREALQLECDVIASSRGGELDVETENFGDGDVASALRAAATREGVRLIVSQREFDNNPAERASLVDLQHAGVEVRVAPVGHGGNEKFCVAEHAEWVGSANATFAGRRRDPTDWGLRTSSPQVAAALHARFREDWNDAHGLA